MSGKESLILECNVKGNIFAKEGEMIGASCKVSDNTGKAFGDFSVSVKNNNGEKNVDFQMSKDLVGNMLIDGMDFSGLFESDGLIDIVGALL